MADARAGPRSKDPLPESDSHGTSGIVDKLSRSRWVPLALVALAVLVANLPALLNLSSLTPSIYRPTSIRSAQRDSSRVFPPSTPTMESPLRLSGIWRRSTGPTVKSRGGIHMKE